VVRIEGAGKQQQNVERQDREDYIKCLLRPDLYTSRGPSTLPLPTSLAQNQGAINAATGASGQLYIILDPLSDSAGSLSVSTTYFDYSTTLLGTVFSGTALSNTRPPTYGVNMGRRVVGAYLSVQCDASALNCSGQVLHGTYVGTSMANSSYTAVTLRNEPGIEVEALQYGGEYRHEWIPCDSNSYDFNMDDTPSGSQTIRSTPIVIISGAPASTTFTIKWRVVIEWLPTAANVNLVMPLFSEFLMNSESAALLARKILKGVVGLSGSKAVKGAIAIAAAL